MITQNYLNSWFDRMNDDSQILVVLDKDDNLLDCFIHRKMWYNREKRYQVIRNYINACTTTHVLPITEYEWHNSKHEDIKFKIILNQEWMILLKKNILIVIEEALKADGINNLKKIKKEVEADKWKYISFYNDEPMLLINATVTDEDYYYVCMRKDLLVRVCSAVGGYELVDEEELSNDYSVLNYLINNDRTSLINKVNELCSNNIDVLLTEP